MTPEPTTTELLDRAARNDRQAWQALVARYQDLVWSVVRVHRLDAASAEDAFQNVWRKLVEKCSTIREPAALPGWLATTARNEAIEALRRTRRVVPSEQSDDVPDVNMPTAEEMLIDDELRRATMRAFARLGADDRHLLRLLCFDELDYRTVATVLDRPVGSIGPSRQRALSALRALLRQELDHGARP